MEKEEKSKLEKKQDNAIKKSEQPDNNTTSEKEQDDFLPSEIIDKMPLEEQRIFKSMSVLMSARSDSPANQFFRKITNDQAGKIIDNIENESKREHIERMSSKKWNCIYLLLILLFIILLSLLFLWKDKSEYIVPIITAFLGGAGGYGFGFGQGQKKSS